MWIVGQADVGVAKNEFISCGICLAIALIIQQMILANLGQARVRLTITPTTRLCSQVYYSELQCIEVSWSNTQNHMRDIIYCTEFGMMMQI